MPFRCGIGVVLRLYSNMRHLQITSEDFRLNPHPLTEKVLIPIKTINIYLNIPG